MLWPSADCGLLKVAPKPNQLPTPALNGQYAIFIKFLHLANADFFAMTRNKSKVDVKNSPFCFKFTELKVRVL